MRLTAHLTAACAVASVGLFLGSVSAAGAAEPIRGKLSQSGYTLIALAANGDARTVVAADGNFSIVPPAVTSTLHLRAADGTYAGPVVLGEKGGEVAAARTKVRRAKRKLRRAKRNLREARASNEPVRRAKRLVRRAKRRLARARAQLEEAQKLQAARPNRAILGVKDGTALGDVEVKSAAGYAKTARLDETQLDATRVARARNGVPVGAGVFGRVVSPFLPGTVPGDADVDGVPDALDISDDGDLVLDNFERSAGANAAQADEFPGAPLYLRSGLEQIRLEKTVNANAADLTVGDVNAVLSTYGRIVLGPPWPHDSAELDCTGLTYCTTGGTGTWFWPPSPHQGQDFPECCDDDDDGYGTMPAGFQLLHHANTRDPALGPTEPQPGTVGTGDILTALVPCSPEGTEAVCPATLQTVLATVPALVSYSDTAGNCAEVPVPGRESTCEKKFSYPVPPPGSDCSQPGCPGGLGTEGNGFPVAAVDGEIEVTFTFWRPQRRPIPPETAQWIDLGGLIHAPAFGCDEGGCGNRYCPPEALTTTIGSELTPTTFGSDQGGLADSAPDRPASPQNTFTYTVNISQCLQDPRSGGLYPGTISWATGQQRQLVFQGTNLLDNSEQVIYFKRVG